MVIKNGSTGNADEVMNAMGSLFNDTAQNLFNADYIGFDSRLANSGTPDLKNVFYSTFTSDDADINFNFEYDSSNDLYKTIDWTAITEDSSYYAIDVYADDVASVPWSSNNTIIRKIDSGLWRVYSIDTSQEVARAQVIKSLFYGTNGTNELYNDFTNITELRTSDSTDDNMTFSRVARSESHTGVDAGGQVYYTYTFSDTSLNTKTSVWATQTGSVIGGDWYDSKLGGNVLWVSASNYGTDTSSKEESNPSTLLYTGHSDNNSSATYTCDHLVGYISGNLSSGVRTDDGLITGFTEHYSTKTDFTIGLGFNASANTAPADSTLIFKDTVTSTDNAIAVINSSIDGANSEQISVSADGGSNYTDVNNALIVRLTAGTALWRKIVITRTDLSKIDKVTEQAVKYNLY